MGAKNTTSWSLLMRNAQAGDQQSYKSLLQQIRPSIEAYIGRRVFDASQLEDLCQEVLLKIHIYRHTYDPDQVFEKWMFTICRNQIIDYLRAKGRRKEVLAVSEEALPVSISWHSGEAQIAMENALAKLPADQAESLRLAKIEGLSLEEVSQKTGASLAAVKVRVHRAVKAIQSAVLGLDD